MSQSSPSLTLVSQLFEPDANWKKIGLALEALPPDESAALRVIQGFRNRQLPAWMTAFLLGRIRHLAGYAVAREILMGEHELSYESYAAVAMARIEPNRAYEDLLRIFRSPSSKRSRRHIVYGLLATQSPRLWDDLLQATLELQLAPLSRAASFLVDCRPTVMQVLTLLRAESPTERKLGLMVVDEQFSKPGVELDPMIVASAKNLLRVPSVVVNSARRKRLTDRLVNCGLESREANPERMNER